MQLRDPDPQDQPAGLFWYHPHHHGSTSKQSWQGLAGAIVVEGDIDRVPEVAAAKERLLVLSEIWVDNQGRVPQGMPVPSAGDVPFTAIPAVPTNIYFPAFDQGHPGGPRPERLLATMVSSGEPTASSPAGSSPRLPRCRTRTLPASARSSSAARSPRRPWPGRQGSAGDR